MGVSMVQAQEWLIIKRIKWENEKKKEEEGDQSSPLPVDKNKVWSQSSSPSQLPIKTAERMLTPSFL